jgi:hypothetical protein
MWTIHSELTDGMEHSIQPCLYKVNKNQQYKCICISMGGEAYNKSNPIYTLLCNPNHMTILEQCGHLAC